MLSLLDVFTGAQVRYEPPQAEAGRDQRIAVTPVSTTVILDGSDSAPGDAPIATYTWMLMPDEQLIGHDATATVELPSRTGTYVIRLTVVDEFGLADDDMVHIAISRRQQP